jgi:hypothetical protein
MCMASHEAAPLQVEWYHLNSSTFQCFEGSAAEILVNVFMYNILLNV